MSRFLITLATVVVAGAMYVAAAPGSQTAGPTAKQFNALKAQVTKLQKQVKVVQSDTIFLGNVIGYCMLHQTVGVAQRGDLGGTFGYSYTNGTTSLTTALDLSGSPTYTLLTLNPDPGLNCASFVGLARHRGLLTRFAHQH
jgi:hypothetical protein